MAATFTTLAAATAAAQAYFTTAPGWVVSVHAKVGSLAIVIGRDLIAREA